MTLYGIKEFSNGNYTKLGIVFADKYGRQSPVVLSSSTDDVTDTFTVPYNVVDQRRTLSPSKALIASKVEWRLILYSGDG